MWSEADIAFVKEWYPKRLTATIAKQLNKSLSQVQWLARGLELQKDHNAERLDTFWSNVMKCDDKCWLWIGPIGNHGYGNFSGGKVYKCQTAHAFSYFIHKGAIPNGLVIDHTCNNRICVNPAHLSAITQKQNVLRSDGPSAKNARKTHCKHGHEFNDLNTCHTKSGKRKCKACWSKTLYIGVSGKKQSGKDSFGNLLMQELGKFGIKSKLTHFADPLKDACIQLFDLDKNKVYGSDADKNELTKLLWDGFPLEVRTKYGEEYIDRQNPCDDPNNPPIRKRPRSGPMSIREILQVIGTDIMRNMVDPDIWAKYPFRNRRFNRHKVVFICDARFPNECKNILDQNGIMIRVERNTGRIDNHPSETALDNYDWKKQNCFIIDNNGTLAELTDKAVNLAFMIKDILKQRNS